MVNCVVWTVGGGIKALPQTCQHWVFPKAYSIPVYRLHCRCKLTEPSIKVENSLTSFLVGYTRQNGQS